jgi:hypothetical protein
LRKHRAGILSLYSVNIGAIRSPSSKQTIEVEHVSYNSKYMFALRDFITSLVIVYKLPESRYICCPETIYAHVYSVNKPYNQRIRSLEEALFASGCTTSMRHWIYKSLRANLRSALVQRRRFDSETIKNYM